MSQEQAMQSFLTFTQDVVKVATNYATLKRELTQTVLSEDTDAVKLSQIRKRILRFNAGGDCVVKLTLVKGMDYSAMMKYMNDCERLLDELENHRKFMDETTDIIKNTSLSDEKKITLIENILM